MRGGAQAHLVEADNGALYIIKFTNNPQGRRILINEWLACAFLRYLQIHVPETTIVEITPEFLEDNPEMYFSIGPKKESISPGLHFGSRMSVNPDRVAIFDFLPDKLLGKIENRVDFLGILAFDNWVSNADSRQAVFFRAKAKVWAPIKGEAPAKLGFFAQMIDHGYAFSGLQWHFQDSPIQGLYFRTSVYDEVQSMDSFQPWLDMIASFPVEVMDAALKEIPGAWMDGDETAVEGVLETLLKRRSRVPDLISDVRQKRTTAFANWR